MLLGAAVFCLALTLYLSNGQTMGSFDSAPTSVLAFNLLERHRLDLDPFRGSYFAPLGGQYAFTEAPNGHLTSVFPVGTAILAFPLYAAIWAVDEARGAPPDLTSPGFEPQRRRDEKVVAAVLAALAVVAFEQCATLLAGPVRAALATGVFALATPMWTIGSQALWQHGPVNLCVLVMVYALLRATRSADAAQTQIWLGCAGLAAGFLPVVRPTALVFTLAGIAFALVTFRGRGALAVVAAAAGSLPGLLWNGYFFHSLVGGYAVNLGSFSASPPAIAGNLAGLLVSPSRGFLVYCPVALYAAAGAVRAARTPGADARLLMLLAGAAAALVVSYAGYTQWWGGYTYGPRFLTDVAAVTGLLVAFRPGTSAHRPRTLRRRAGSAVFATALGWSVCVQFAGANSGAGGADWNAVPVSIDAVPERLWRVSDNQIERNALAAYVKDFAWNMTLGAAYRRGLAAHVVPFAAPQPARAGQAVIMSAVVRNDGTSRLYGYASGVYTGQIRIAVRIVDRFGRSGAEQNLYLAGSPEPTSSALATGTVVMPRLPGRYTLRARPVSLGFEPFPTGPSTDVMLDIR